VSSKPRKRNANGEGTAYRRPDGRWAAQAYINQSDGRRVRRTLYGSTRKEVERKMTDLVDRESRGRPIVPLALTLEAYLNEWLTQIVAVRVRGNTLSHYKFQIDRYLVPDLGRKKLAQLSARDLRLYFDSLRRRGVGARTVQYVHSTLRAALEDAVREELLDKNVAKLVRVPAPPRTEPRPLTVDEVRAFLKSSRDDRLYAMFLVFALLGLRRSEVLGLRWEDLDLEHGFLQIRRGLQRIDGQLQVLPTKTARSRRTVPLPSIVVSALQAHVAAQNRDRLQLAERWPDLGYVFTTPIGTPIDPRNCTRVVQAACTKAGLRAVRLHDFRHGCVSVLLSLGVPPRTAMDIVGHSTIEVTMNVYGHVTLDDKRTALDKVGDLFEEDEQ
jgi:integrase